MATTPKQETLERVAALPDDATMDQILYELHIQTKITRRLEQFERGETVSHEDVMKRLGRRVGSAHRA
jgi:hypothetical protein